MDQQLNQLPRKLGKYSLGEQIGAGGMGTVWKGEHPEFKIPIAIKTITKTDEDESYVQRFLQEGRSTARLHHPRIARVFDAGTDGNTHYIVMEYVSGGSVSELLAGGPIASARAIKITRAAAEGLKAAAKAGIVHRDIKPANMMIDGDGEVKLVDLGLAREVHGDSTLTATNTLIGTPAYIAPEQAHGDRTVDVRTDIYSLGATLFHMVTGELPYAASTPMQMAVKHCVEPAPDPRQWDSGLPDDLCSLIMRMMAKKPEDRYQTADELIAAIDNLSLDDRSQAKVPVVPPSKRGIAVLCSVVLVACAAWLLHPNNRAKEPAAPAPPATAAVAVANALYAAIDVSGGPDAEQYPVTYLSEVPSDLLADPKWRTTTILLRRLSAGEFVMGTPASEPYREEMQNEETQHRVTLTEDYFIGIFEVTQRQWELVVGGNSSLEKGDLLPVANLLYHDIRGRTAGARHPATHDVDGDSFMGKLRQKTDLMLDLPTEAQWEYACRAGTRTAYHFGDNPNDLHNYGNYRDVSHGSGDQGYVVVSDGVARSSAVGSYRPNAWGLYDMHGNVSEWCLDWYEPAMTDGHVVDPLGQGKEGKRSLRGLSWKFAARFNRAGIRYGWDLKAPRHDTGFRLVMAPSQITVDRPSAQQSPPRRAENWLYAAINVSGGANVDRYPVSYLKEVPPDLLADPKWRTTTLLLRHVPAGRFVMGTPGHEPFREFSGHKETTHQVTLTKDFYMGVFEVTQRQWELIMGSNPSEEKGDMLPVANLSYHDIRGRTAGAKFPATRDVDDDSFMGQLRRKTNLMLDLPTEAQWEYTCRANTQTAYNFGDNPQDLHKYGNYRDVTHSPHEELVVSISDGSMRSRKVGSYLPNAWGFYDMHGNVSEWCLDWHEKGMKAEAVTDPVGNGEGEERALRGGSWRGHARHTRSGSRYGWQLKVARHDTGLRVIMLPE